MQYSLQRDYNVLRDSIAASETREEAEIFLDESVRLLEYHDALHACALKAWHARRRELATQKNEHADAKNSNHKVDYP